jgi:hypothetical protein
MTSEHPQAASLPHAGLLGPDPEPIGVRADTLARAYVRIRPTRHPQLCPLAQVLGRHSPCIEGACIYYRVPGASRQGCAVLEWAPSVARQPALAEWFMERKRDVALAEEAGSRILVPVHDLPTPGPGD